MTETRRMSEEYARIGSELIRTEASLADVRNSDATIVYLASDKAKASGGRAVLGECERVPDKWMWAVEADYAVTVYEPNVSHMGEEQLRILIFHELLHILIDYDKDENEVHRIRQHDLQDFREVVDRFGVDWDK